MNGGKEQGAWIQCAHCGEIYYIETPVPIDKLYVASYCPKCGEYGNGLNCGSDESEVYVYYNPLMDDRFYRY